ncbi:ribbon-helix-helix protein, CopG family [Alcanivorax sp.]|uniref:ribbon-helix-helix protein, CopG family n=1 Tax=unclassified Alcanivorax TaxID=2638842 RepID=UPI0011AF4DC0
MPGSGAAAVRSSIASVRYCSTRSVTVKRPRLPPTRPFYLFIEEAKEKLDKIAERQKRSRHDIVEDWVLHAFEKGDF